MNDDERKRIRNTRYVFLAFGLTVMAAVVSIAVFMYRMITKS